MNKRGMSLTFETLVVAIIVLVVLGVVIAIFITKSGEYAGKYDDVANRAENQAKGCNMLFGRQCSSGSSCDSGYKPVGQFDECKSGDNPKGICCEKTGE